MHARVAIALGMGLLAGCAEPELTPSEQAASDERAIAEVVAAQTPPPDVVAPERITAEDRQRLHLGDNGCIFAVDSPELGAHAILQMNVGYMKFAGAMERFAPDAGSGDGPAGTTTSYDGGRHALDIRFDRGAADKAQGDRLSVPTQITLKDGRGRTVYVAEGTALCG